MATATIPHTPRNHNDTQARAEALRAAHDRLNALPPAEMLNANLFVNVEGMEDPYSFNRENPRAWR
jgi:hypothetical protein